MDLFKKYYQIAENKQPLLEEIYSGKAIIYHRTNKKDLINGIYKHKFVPGDGDTFGKGIYGTYELRSQTDEKFNMKDRYGPFIIKFMINSLNRFLILDYDQFIKTPLSKKMNSNKKTYIIDQLKYFNFDKIEPFDDLDLSAIGTYKLAGEIFLYYDKYINKIIDGMIFTSKEDDKVLVCYNNNLIIPLSFSLDDGKTWIKADKNNKYLKMIFSQNTDELLIKRRSDLSRNHWIRKAKISKDSKFTLNIEQDHFIWHIGTWEDGTWEDGTWEDGTWHKGTWEDGTWHKGTWKDGTWKWGIWYGGTWENGAWEGGDWWQGTWLGGYDKNGKYHPEGDSPDKWEL